MCPCKLFYSKQFCVRYLIFKPHVNIKLKSIAFLDDIKLLKILFFLANVLSRYLKPRQKKIQILQTFENISC